MSKTNLGECAVGAMTASARNDDGRLVRALRFTLAADLTDSLAASLAINRDLLGELRGGSVKEVVLDMLGAGYSVEMVDRDGEVLTRIAYPRSARLKATDDKQGDVSVSLHLQLDTTAEDHAAAYLAMRCGDTVTATLQPRQVALPGVAA